MYGSTNPNSNRSRKSNKAEQKYVADLAMVSSSSQFVTSQRFLVFMRSVYFQVVENTGPLCRAKTRENTKFGHRFTGKHQIPTKSPSGGQIYLPMNSRNGQSLPLAMETLEPVGEERRQQHTRSFIALSADSSEQCRI